MYENDQGKKKEKNPLEGLGEEEEEEGNEKEGWDGCKTFLMKNLEDGCNVFFWGGRGGFGSEYVYYL